MENQQIRKFGDIEQFIQEHPQEASSLAAQWSTFLKENPQAQIFKTSQQWYEWIRSQPEKMIDPDLWVCHEVALALALARPAEIDQPPPQQEKPTELPTELLGLSLSAFLKTKTTIMGNDQRYLKIASSIQKDWLKNNPGKNVESDEWFDFINGTEDGQPSEMHQKAEEEFRKQYPEKAAHYDKIRNKIHDNPLDDPHFGNTQWKINQHAGWRYNRLKSQKKEADFETVKAKIANGAWEEFINKHPEKAAAYAEKIKALPEEKRKNFNHFLDAHGKAQQIASSQSPITRIAPVSLDATSESKTLTAIPPQSGSRKQEIHTIATGEETEEQRLQRTGKTRSWKERLFGQKTHAEQGIYGGKHGAEGTKIPSAKPRMGMFNRISSGTLNRINRVAQYANAIRNPRELAKSYVQDRVQQAGMRQVGKYATRAGSRFAAPVIRVGTQLAVRAGIGIVAAVGWPVIIGVGAILVLFLIVIIAWQGGSGWGTSGPGTPIAGLSLTVEGPDQVPDVEDLTYTIRVTYAGSEDVVITNPIPIGTTLINTSGILNPGSVPSWSLRNNASGSPSSQSPATFPDNLYKSYGFPDPSAPLQMSAEEAKRWAFLSPLAQKASQAVGVDVGIVGMWPWIENRFFTYMDNCSDNEFNPNTFCAGWGGNWQVGLGNHPADMLIYLKEALNTMYPGKTAQEIGQQVITNSSNQSKYPSGTRVLPLTQPDNGVFPNVSVDEIVTGAQNGDRNMRMRLGILMKDEALGLYLIAKNFKNKLNASTNLASTMEGWSATYYARQRVINYIAGIYKAGAPSAGQQYAFTITVRPEKTDMLVVNEARADIVGGTSGVGTGGNTSNLLSCEFFRGDQQPPGKKYNSQILMNYFQEASQRSNVPAFVLAAIARVESPGIVTYTDTNLSTFSCPRSPTGALGLMQIQPRGTLGHDASSVRKGAEYLGLDYNTLIDADYCDMKKNIFMAAGFINQKRLYITGKEWDTSKTFDKSYIDSVASSYYGCLRYPSCSSGPYSYGDDVWNSVQSCK